VKLSDYEGELRQVAVTGLGREQPTLFLSNNVKESARSLNPLYVQHVFSLYEYRRGDCPAAERVYTEAFWVSHEIMLARPDNLGDFVAVVAKVSEGAAELARNAAI
jgi:hypothetical protein